MTRLVIKTCTQCGNAFSSGKQGSLGYQFWWTALTLIGGIVYYFLRHRERCPHCDSPEFMTKTIDVDIPG